MADQEKTPILGRHARQSLDRLGYVEAARQGRVLAQQGPLTLAPALGRQLGGRAGPDLGAVEDLVEGDRHVLDRDARGPSLLLSPSRQAPLRVRPGPVGLGVGVT